MSTERKFDKSRFKGTSMKAMQTADDAVDKTLGKENKKTRGEFHTLEKGLNYFRIYPHHNAVREMCGESDPSDKGETFAESRVIYYLPQWVEDKDDKGNVKLDGKKKPIMKEIQKSVFDSRIHGGTEKDIVDEYIKFVMRYAEETFNNETQKAEKEQFLENIVGNWKKRISGLAAKTSWVIFCDHITKYDVLNDKVEKKFGKLEFGKAVKIGLQKIAAQEQGNQPLGTDPFTDPTEGIAICIDYNPDADKAMDYYNVGLYQPKIGAGQFKIFELTETDLDALLGFDSLYKQYRGVYRRRDFNIALEGLKNFDMKYEYGLVDSSEFIAIIEEISSYYPEDEETKDATDNTTDAGAADETTDTDQDEFDLMTRDELKKFHKDNKTGFVCVQKTTDEALKTAAREWKIDHPEEGEEQTAKAVEKVEETKTDKEETAAEKAKRKLAELRKNK